MTETDIAIPGKMKLADDVITAYHTHMIKKINRLAGRAAPLALLALMGCVAPPQGVQPLVERPPVKAKQAEHHLNGEEFALVRSVNALRKERGLPGLDIRDDLSLAARKYAERLATEKFFDHVSPEGQKPTDRADAVGYDWRRLGETLAAGQTSAQAAAQSWRDSPGHAKIIFDPKHVHVGVGFWRQKSKDPMKPELEHFWVLLAGATR